MLSPRYRRAAAAARVLIAADRPPGDPLLRDAIARALDLAPTDAERHRWQAYLDAVDAGHTIRFKIRTPTGTLTPELFSEVESIFTPH
jgi:hypothetical protein